MKKSIKNILRWIAVIPGSLIAGLLSTFPLHWLLYFAYAHNGTLLGFIELPDGSNITIEHAIYPVVVALTFILVGYEIAPKYKFKTVVILAVLYILFAASILFFAKKNNIDVSLEMRSIGPLIGLAIGLFSSWQKANKG